MTKTPTARTRGTSPAKAAEKVQDNTKTPTSAPPAERASVTAVEPIWYVRDTNARPGKMRVHTGPDRQPIKLGNAEPGTRLKREVAMTFLCDPAFIVIDENGERVDPISRRAFGRGDALTIDLEPNETVAHFSELTDHALLARAYQFDGGPAFSFKTHKRKEIEQFVMREASRLRGQLKADIPDDEDADAMRPSESAALIGDLDLEMA